MCLLRVEVRCRAAGQSRRSSIHTRVQASSRADRPPSERGHPGEAPLLQWVPLYRRLGTSPTVLTERPVSNQNRVHRGQMF